MTITKKQAVTTEPVTEKKQPRAIVFTDWDGTVTLQDSNFFLTDELGMGPEARKKLNEELITETVTFRDGFRKALESIAKNGHSFQYCIEYLLQRIKLDPGFREFYEYCHENGIPLYVISSGMTPIIKALLEKLVGVDAMQNIKVVANDVKVNGDDWEIVYRDDTPYGHDKNASIRNELKKYGYGAEKEEEEKPVLFYCGDGVSDISAAGSCDLLFARRGEELVDICRERNFNFRQFDSFKTILNDVNDVVSGDVKLEDLFEK
ncbi:unnamed protein product [Ambrosiozyma monospora]|uniref:Unnamed protein product n=1 Tax=Ambrosiozyma monospora TaxID=43982 RepID=A0ACB5U0H7_AMBMO|nr:unnamed protein product [Ambrosiozyma monospora]